MSEEKWKDLEGVWGEVYQVSNKGRMKRKQRTIHTSNGRGDYFQTLPELILSQRTNGIHPHVFCDLGFTPNKGKFIRRSAYIHKEVAIAFLTPPPTIIRKKQIGNSKYYKKSTLPARYVEHIDGDYTNNVPSNLRWINQLELYNKQIQKGRKPKMDLYTHSPLYKTKKDERIY